VSKAIEVITSVERRRRWSAAEKEQLVAASLEPSASVSGVAREAGIHARRQYLESRISDTPFEITRAFARS
jgi:transposase-like protein